MDYKKFFQYSKMTIVFIIKTIFVYIYWLFVRRNKKYKDIWLIAERFDEARDNGYHLFKYIRTNHPEINCYYVLDENSPDLRKIKQLGNIIKPKSIRHYLYFLASKKAISTHTQGACPEKTVCVPFLKLLPAKKIVFLQHGVTKDALKVEGRKVDLMVCSAEFEKKCIEDANPTMKDNLKILGLCRFDQLDEKKDDEKIILIMPTFRRWIDYNKFKEQNYFIRWNNVLNDKKLIQYIEKNDIKIIFFPHSQIQKYIENFTTNSKNIIIGKIKDYDIQDLLIKSCLLVTDFSSVFFDYAYMKKPIIYYQFDEQEYRQKHLKKGLFDYRVHAFGKVILEHQDTIKEIIDISDNYFLMDKEYINRVERFFKYTDKQNTKRNFEAILNI